MMEYSVSQTGTVIASGTVVYVNPAAAPLPNLEFMRFWMGQNSTATSAQLGALIYTQVTTFPTVVSATPAKLKRAGPVSSIAGGIAGAAGTSGVFATVEGGGAKTTVFTEGFNNLNGYLWVATPREVLVMPAGSASAVGLQIVGTPSALTGWFAGANYAEV